MTGHPPFPHRLLRASAGTGKTYQLVQAYADAVEAGLDPADIVAITFTRKAAAELRYRIVRELERRGVGADRQGELGRALIGNFHVLALQLLRGAGLQNEVLRGRWRGDASLLGTSGQDRLLFLRCCEEAWFSDSVDPQLKEDVAQLAGYFGMASELPSALWDGMSKAREDGQEICGASLLALADPRDLRARLDEILVSLRDRLASVRAQQTAKGKADIDAFLSATPPPDGCTHEQWVDTWRHASTLISRRGRYKTEYTEDDQRILKRGVPHVLAEAVCAELGAPLIRMVDRVWSAYTQAKYRERTIDFADLLETVVDWLRGDAFAHRRICSSVKLVLVDEAQDTNRIQHDFVRLLAGFDGPAAVGPPASLFVVGDRKQAIYTFRGANPESFELFVRDVQEAGGEQELLRQSRRSTPEVVDAINDLGTDLFGADYEALESLPGSAPTVSAKPAVLYVNMGEDDARNVVNAAKEAQTVAGWIAQRISTGEKPGDFAVLFNTMTHGGPVCSGAGTG